MTPRNPTRPPTARPDRRDRSSQARRVGAAPRAGNGVPPAGRGRVPADRGRATRRPEHRTQSTARAATPSVLALLLCLGLLAAIFDNVFKVKRIEIVGANLPQAQLVAASGVMGANIFRVRSDSVVARLSSLREIVVTGVHTALPDRVIIDAQARPAYAAWRTAQGLFRLDEDGNVIDRVSHTSLPVITGTVSNVSVGPGVIAAVRYAVQVVPAAPKGTIAGIRYGPKDGLTISGTAGWRAIVGTGSTTQLLNRVADLVGVLRAALRRSESLRSVDLRYPNPVGTFVSP